MNGLVAVLLAGIAFRLIPEAPTEALALLVLALILAISEVPSTRYARKKI